MSKERCKKMFCLTVSRLLKMEGEIKHIALVLHTCKHYCKKSD